MTADAGERASERAFDGTRWVGGEVLMRHVRDSCAVDLAREAGLISAYLDDLWAEWPEVSTVVATWQRESREPTPRETVQLDLIYDCFPFLFYPDFPTVALDDIRMLAQAGRLYAFHAFLSDGFMDTQSLRRADAVLRSSLVQAKALHLLYRLFPPDSPFWPEFDRFQHAYFGALRLEQQWREMPMAEFELSTAESIGSGKAALTGAAVAAMALLGNDEERASALHESLHLAHIGLQFYDDLRDWKVDLVDGQPSLVLADLCREVGWKGLPESAQQRSEQVPRLKRSLYESGVAHVAATRAADYFERAQAALGALTPPASTPREQLTWRRLLRDCHRATTELARDLRRQSPTRTMAEVPASVPETISNNAASQTMLDRAFAYLAAGQGKEGEWGDFLFSIGHSTDWVSGYVGQAILPIPAAKPQVARAAEWLLGTSVEGSWGYNTRAPRDADSTSNAGLFLATLFGKQSTGSELSERTLPVLRKTTTRLARYQHPSGGFSTYITEDGANGYYVVGQNWLEPHIEITATCGRFFLATTGKLSPVVRRALAYLVANQSANGAWMAYWYDGPYYGTTQVIRFFHEAAKAGWREPTLAACVNSAVRLVLTRQRPDGAWSLRDVDDAPQPVATALALHSLIESGALLRMPEIAPQQTDAEASALAQETAESIRRGTEWLRQHQRADGSWAPSYILRVPAPDCAQPWQSDFPRSMRGDLNHVTRDQQRFFTVASIVQALVALQTQSHLLPALETVPDTAPTKHR